MSKDRKPDDRRWGETSDITEIYSESADDIVVCLGRALFVDAKGDPVVLKSWRVGGDLWCVEYVAERDVHNVRTARVSPPRLHAYCLAGGADLSMLELDLRTRRLTSGLDGPLDRYLDAAQFGRLILVLRKKFPDVDLTL